jgi:hypothetical protein
MELSCEFCVCSNATSKAKTDHLNAIHLDKSMSDVNSHIFCGPCGKWFTKKKSGKIRSHFCSAPSRNKRKSTYSDTLDDDSPAEAFNPNIPPLVAASFGHAGKKAKINQAVVGQTLNLANALSSFRPSQRHWTEPQLTFRQLAESQAPFSSYNLVD